MLPAAISVKLAEVKSMPPGASRCALALDLYYTAQLDIDSADDFDLFARRLDAALTESLPPVTARM
jgi:hypothetical protein